MEYTSIYLYTPTMVCCVEEGTGIPSCFWHGTAGSSPAYLRLWTSLEEQSMMLLLMGVKQGERSYFPTERFNNFLRVDEILSKSLQVIQPYFLAGDLKADEKLIIEQLIKNIPGMPSLLREDMPGFLQCCDGSDFMFDFCVRPFLRQSEASCVIFNSFEDLEGEVVNGLRQQDPECNFHGIGPVLPLEYFSGGKLSHVPSNNALAYFPEDFDCLKWLDTQEKATVLYISFGSLTELTGSELEEFALGLEASGLPLLWVLRPDVLEGGGPAALPAGFEERTRERARIISWAPQLHVLAHPSVGAFLTHAGWNSTLEGIAQGLPLLGFPYFADQMINCRFIQDVWANGLAFDRHTGGGPLTRGLVEKKAKAVMGDAKLREKAVQLQDSARRAVTSHQGSSTTALHKIVQALRTH